LAQLKLTVSKGVFAPTDWLSFRASYGTSFRAPNLGEQFGGRVTGFANPSDPCRVPGVAVPFQDTDGDGHKARMMMIDVFIEQTLIHVINL
jgi:iron complex outermembrane receptor protein